MVNIWNPYQCMVTFNMSRSASYFESGIGRGMGFRDSNQDLLGFVHLVPERARERILDIAATQFADGSAYHQYQPLTKRGNNDVGSGFNDDPLWLILGVAAYIKETGDYAILDEQVPFDNDAKNRRAAARALQALVRPRARQPRPARAAADRARRLERLPEPELLLRDARRVVSDDRQPRGPHRRIVFIAGMFVHIGPEYAALLRAAAASRTRPSARRTRSQKMERAVLDARLGRRVVPARLRLFRQQGRQQRVRGRPDLHRAAGLLRHGRHRRRRPARPRRRSTRSRSGSTRSTASCSATRPTPSTTSSSARSRRTRPATRKTPASSATTTPGS